LNDLDSSGDGEEVNETDVLVWREKNDEQKSVFEKPREVGPDGKV